MEDDRGAVKDRALNMLQVSQIRGPRKKGHGKRGGSVKP